MLSSIRANLCYWTISILISLSYKLHPSSIRAIGIQLCQYQPALYCILRNICMHHSMFFTVPIMWYILRFMLKLLSNEWIVVSSHVKMLSNLSRIVLLNLCQFHLRIMLKSEYQLLKLQYQQGLHEIWWKLQLLAKWLDNMPFLRCFIYNVLQSTH